MPAARSWSLMGGYASVSLPLTLKPRAASMHASEPIAVPHTPTKCTCWISSIGGMLRGKEGLPDEVVHVRSQFEPAALRDQVDAVGEQHHDHAALEVDPEARSGEARVTDRALGEVRARRRLSLGRGVPAGRPVARHRTAGPMARRWGGDLLAAEELARDLGGEERGAAPV